ncbi:MAG: L-fucose isomerase [Bifidobacteriaceae bacterium]|jgi:L-fucose isomerase|nr:L-fucose isomerase [Bifidobacteriaceae bacterium]
MDVYPVIGVRPTIDGRRRGVRESLEGQTMAQARAVAELLSGALRYRDGQPVRCVVADTTIGGVVEAAACAQKFAAAGVGLTITVTPCWCYGTETMDLDPTMPHAVWGFNGTERPGAVYLAAVMSAYAQRGIPAFAVYGHDVQDSSDLAIPRDVAAALTRFARAGLAVAQMRGRSYLSVGSVSMGIAGSVVKDDFFFDYLGMRNEYVDMSEVSRRIDQGIYDPDVAVRALGWARRRCVQGFDNNRPDLVLSSSEHAAQWEYVVKMTLVLADLMEGNPRLAELGHMEEAQGHDAIVAGFQGQRQWTDGHPNGDFAETILNSSFDWSGPRRPKILATENDSLNGVSMLFGHLLTGRGQLFADVRTYWSPRAVERVAGHRLDGDASDGLIHLINSGSGSLDAITASGWRPFWELDQATVDTAMSRVTFHPANREYFPGGGFSTRFLSDPAMPVTMCRLNLVKGLGPALQIAEGVTVGLPPQVHDVLDQRTDPTWPTTWFAPRLTGHGAFTSTYEVMNHWGANHGAITFGHIGADLVTLAAMLRIPVAMHNLEPGALFRPRMWGLFGTDQPEAADYRACATLGPVYR